MYVCMYVSMYVSMYVYAAIVPIVKLDLNINEQKTRLSNYHKIIVILCFMKNGADVG